MAVCCARDAVLLLGVVGLFPELLNAPLQPSVWRYHSTVTALL